MKNHISPLASLRTDNLFEYEDKVESNRQHSALSKTYFAKILPGILSNCLQCYKKETCVMVAAYFIATLYISISNDIYLYFSALSSCMERLGSLVKVKVLLQKCSLFYTCAQVWSPRWSKEGNRFWKKKNS